MVGRLKALYHSRSISIFDYLETQAAKKYFLWKLLVILFLWVLVTSFPIWNLLVPFHWDMWELMVYRSNHLLEPLPKGLPEFTDKYAFRMTIPLLGKIACLNKEGFFLLQAIFGLLLFGTFYSFIKKSSNDTVAAALLTMGLGCTYIGKMAFYEIFPFFDSAALLFILCCFFLRGPYFLLVSLLAYFTDERALISSCVLFLYFLRFDDLSKSNYLQLVWLITSWVFYFILRYFFTEVYGLDTGLTSLGFEPLISNYQFGPLPLLLTFEGFLIVIILTLFILYKKSFLGFLLLSGGILLISVVSFMVYDLGRSLSYLFTPIVLGLIIVQDYVKKSTYREIAFIVAISCAVIPTMRFFGKGLDWMGPIFPKILSLF